MFAVTTLAEISDERIAGLLCCAFEGGSNYWIREVIAYEPEGWAREGWAQKFTRAQVLPTTERGFVIVVDDTDGAELRLDRAAVERGLQLMADGKAAPRWHWQAFLDENDDAETGDVFLQLCLLGELRYG